MRAAPTRADPTGLRATAVAAQAGGRTILRPTSLEVPVGSLVGLIGPSGSGKSTLLRVLAGVLVPSGGDVALDGAPVDERLDDVGYVPFGTLVHPELTVREALRYAALLRLPHVAGAEVDARVQDVLEQLQVLDRADARIAGLSDGERRRVSCGIELVGRPSVLLLDEPTTGLDAALERQLMRLLRRLADEGRGVLVATHATSSLRLCDVVAVMGPGGELRFVGAPDEVLARFGVAHFDEVYEALTAEVPEALPDEVDEAGGPAPVRLRAPRKAAPPFSTQLGVLASRYARCTVRNRRVLALLLGQAPVIGLAIALVVPREAAGEGGVGSYYAVMLGFLLLTGALWLGLTASCREVVRERAILDREAAIGVRLEAYLAAKCAVLLPLAALQAALLALPVVVLQPLDVDVRGQGQVLLMCAAIAWSAVAMGLWLSAAVRTVDQATGSVPLVLIPQLLLAGAIVPLASMLPPFQLLANVAVSRWGLTGLGSAMDLDLRLSGDFAAVTGFEPSFYAPPITVSLGLLLAATLIMLSRAGARLARRR